LTFILEPLGFYTVIHGLFTFAWQAADSRNINPSKKTIETTR